MILSGEFSIDISVSQAYLHYISVLTCSSSGVGLDQRLDISVQKQSIKLKNNLPLCKNKAMKVILNCLPEIFNV